MKLILLMYNFEMKPSFEYPKLGFKVFYIIVFMIFGYRRIKIWKKTDWLASCQELEENAKTKNKNNVPNWRDIYHLVIIPIYKEGLEIVQPTIDSIPKSVFAPRFPLMNTFLISL